MISQFNQSIHISRIELCVSNLQQSLDYYVRDLGFSLIEKADNYARIGSPDFEEFVRLVERKNSTPQNRSTGLYHFAILLPSRKALGMFLRHIIKKQIPLLGSADHGVSEAFYLQDPDRNSIEIYADRSESDWYDESHNLTMYTKELDYPEIYYSCSDDDIFQGLPLGTKFGHLHLSVSKIAPSRHFYENVIGFKATIETFPKALFLADSNYHHHLAINTWLGAPKKNKDNQSTGLQSIYISFPNCESIAKTIGKIHENNMMIEETSFGYKTIDPDQNTVYLQLAQ